MNDRFKFRVWVKDTKEYHYHGATFFADVIGDDNYVIEQCTGLKDEGEDLIYENDIVELDDGTEMVNAIIEWNKNAGCWDIRTSDTIYTFDNLYGNEIRIIGNIHENADLLGEDR